MQVPDAHADVVSGCAIAGQVALSVGYDGTVKVCVVCALRSRLAVQLWCVCVYVCVCVLCASRGCFAVHQRCVCV